MNLLEIRLFISLSPSPREPVSNLLFVRTPELGPVTGYTDRMEIGAGRSEILRVPQSTPQAATPPE